MGALDRSAASSFVYAKASGLLSKSFVGDNAGKLFSVQSLRELYTLLFGGEVPSVPEVLLSKEIEVKAEQRFLAQYKSLLNEFENPSPILSEIIKFYEYEISDDFGGEKDREQIMSLWHAVSSLKGADRANLAQLYKMEISFKNILWVLRLKVYYHFSPEEILDQLVYADDSRPKDDILAREALSIINNDIASYDDWKKWKYAQFLNPHEEGVIWEIDPCWIERALKHYLSKAYRRFFHKDPMSVTSLVSWFRIKQYELNCIRSVAEGLRLGVESDKVMEIAGYSSAQNA
ncbi:V-type ATPase subunit [uncultured Treponema sp.]|uniref:V0D/AC39 family V-type ATPase subunit n=1 Tax=uncultured Treponema sp. TaxID=162155 RepID=UPI0025E2C156|nr:V-type ATPase subunit [uncultured Treponema sp.]